MKFAFFLLFSSFLALGCQLSSTENPSISSKPFEGIVANPADSIRVDTAHLKINLTPKGNYNQLKAKIRTKKATHHSKEDFENFLLNEIIPHWYGTEWDFNGYTAIPGQGEIACGYFVSTTLEHLGIVINRYHLAQQAGLNEAKSLAIEDSNYFTVYGWAALHDKMRSYQDGIYFVGLDNHVGYLYKEGPELYFIHSNYIEDRVMIEKAAYSPAFQSNIYVVAELSTNELLLERWRTGTRVEVVR
ncbi:MAG: hypothetical protein NXI10_11860 [bacterium]|nr:hypothetical protein [bacterium]